MRYMLKNCLEMERSPIDPSSYTHLKMLQQMQSIHRGVDDENKNENSLS